MDTEPTLKPTPEYHIFSDQSVTTYNPDSHNEYNRLLHEYQDAKEVYELDDSRENWDRMQEALVRLKRHTDRMDIKRG